MKIHSFAFNPFQENTYVLFDDSKECVIIDPGCFDNQEESKIVSFIENNELKPVFLLNTHCHIDHVLGNDFIMKKYNLDLYAHENEKAVLKSCEVVGPSYGFHNYKTSSITKEINESEVIQFGHTKLEILFLPGHSPGHVAFIHHETKSVIGGDVLFKHSIGRTDLPGGNHETLIKSIREKLFLLPDDYVVYPGHGPETILGDEKLYNPFVGEKA